MTAPVGAVVRHDKDKHGPLMPLRPPAESLRQANDAVGFDTHVVGPVLHHERSAPLARPDRRRAHIVIFAVQVGVLAEARRALLVCARSYALNSGRNADSNVSALLFSESRADLSRATPAGGQVSRARVVAVGHRHRAVAEVAIRRLEAPPRGAILDVSLRFSWLRQARGDDGGRIWRSRGGRGSAAGLRMRLQPSVVELVGDGLELVDGHTELHQRDLWCGPDIRSHICQLTGCQFLGNTLLGLRFRVRRPDGLGGGTIAATDVLDLSCARWRGRRATRHKKYGCDQHHPHQRIVTEGSAGGAGSGV